MQPWFVVASGECVADRDGAPVTSARIPDRPPASARDGDRAQQRVQGSPIGFRVEVPVVYSHPSCVEAESTDYAYFPLANGLRVGGNR